MGDGFVPLELLLTDRMAAAPCDSPEDPLPETPRGRGNATVVEPATLAEADDAAAAVRRFHAALSDALEVALHDLLREIACDVLARELRVTPADVAAVAAGVLARFAADEPVRVRVHPDDLPLLPPSALATAGDASLRRGDVILEVRSGTIDATLGARLEAVLGRR